MEEPTLAAKLGTTTQLSPLLLKARRLGFDAEGLERLAIQRGCDYYDSGKPFAPLDVSIEQFSNAELILEKSLSPRISSIAFASPRRRKRYIAPSPPMRASKAGGPPT
jgi:hypothetical protein